MGRFAETAGGQFLQNTMYKPNADMEMALAAQEVQSDALDKSFSNLPEYEADPTFKAWQPEQDRVLGEFNEGINPIVEQLRKDPFSKEALRSLKQKQADAKILFSSGQLGMQSRIFKEDQAYIAQKQAEIANEKDATKKGMMRQKLNDYRAETTRRVQGGYEEGFNLAGYSDYYDAQGALKNKDSGIDVEAQQYTKDTVMTKDPVIKVGKLLQPVSEGSIGANGKYKDAQGVEHDVYRTPEAKMLSLGLKYQSQTVSNEIKGYFQQDIANQARALLANPAYMSSLKDDYERFGHSQGFDTLAEYIDAQMDKEVGLFASQYHQVTSEKESRKDYFDKGQADLDGDARQFAHEKKMASLKHGYAVTLGRLKGDIPPEEVEAMANSVVMSKTSLFHPDALKKGFQTIYDIQNRRKLHAEGKPLHPPWNDKESVKMQQIQGMYESAFRDVPMRLDMREAIETLQGGDGEFEGVEYQSPSSGFEASNQSGYWTKKDPETGELRVLSKEERVKYIAHKDKMAKAQALVDKNKDKFDEFSEKMAENNTWKQSAIQIGDGSSKIDKMALHEMNLSSTLGVQMFNPKYATHSVGGVGYTEKRDPTMEGVLENGNLLTTVLNAYKKGHPEASDMEISDMFEEKSILRSQTADGVVEWRGTMRQDILNAAGDAVLKNNDWFGTGIEVQGGKDVSRKLAWTTELSGDTGKTMNIVKDTYGDDPEALAHYKYGTDGRYQKILESTELQVLSLNEKLSNSKIGYEKGELIGIPGKDIKARMGKNEQGKYYLFIDGDEQERFPFLNDQGELVGYREVNTLKDVQDAIKSFSIAKEGEMIKKD